ncbi:glycosyltransferase family 4 protein [Devosia sp.]|uniref:glycosyltransferase family 4 protein n=1 Tax=Devosia sp. TaxID=1871048 RepID=UPI002F227DB7
MRVLHFYKTTLPDTVGGIERVIDEIARGTSRLGVEVETLSLARRPGTITMDGYRAHRAKLDFELASTGFSLGVVGAFSRLARRADIVHYHFPWPFMDLVHFIARAKVPTLVTYHSDIIRQKHLARLYRPLEERFLGDVDRIVATSPNYLASSEILQRHRHKTSIIPIGLDRALYPQPSADRVAWWRSRLGQRFFLFVGVLRYYKGLHILLEAARGTDYPVAIVGAGPIEAELRAQAARAGLTNVHFLGFLPDEEKVALLQASHAIVFPSNIRSEAFGVSLLEGAMHGKPMISSEIGTGTTYVNVPGETGVVVAPDDPEALRRAMRRLWQDPEEAAAMGRKAEARFRALFTARRMAEQYVRLYQDLLAGARG